MTMRYSTNWMGPVALQWYRARGLLTKDARGGSAILPELHWYC
jgi:hypothetical protein